MIRLERRRSGIHEHFRDEGRVRWTKKLLKQERDFRGGKTKKRILSRHVWKEAKVQLFSETHGKCAYCEAQTKSVSYGDVEHYRPKSTYWWLAYCLDNFLGSCTICNNSKGKQFPISGQKWHGPSISADTTDSEVRQLAAKITPDPKNPESVSAYTKIHHAELCLVINPYMIDPKNIFAWKVDDLLREVEIAVDSSKGVSAEFSRTIEVVGLNRLELKQLRYTTLEHYNMLRRCAEESTLQKETRTDVRDGMRKMTQDASQFAGMIRYFEARRSQ